MCQKMGRTLPPASFGQNPKESIFFLSRMSLSVCGNFKILLHHSIIDVVLMDLVTISFIKPSTNSSEWAQQASHGFKATSNGPRWTSVIPLRTFRTRRDMMAIHIQIYIFIDHSVGCVCQFAKYQFSGIQCIKCRLWKYSTTCAYINRCHAPSLETRKAPT